MKIIVEDGGLLKLATAADPFAGRTEVLLANGAQLDPGAGRTLTSALLKYDGVIVANNRYQKIGGADPTAEPVAWMAGDAVLAVDGKIAYWKQAVDGTWDDETKWAPATPASDIAVNLTAEGASYTVTVDETPARPTGLIVINESADETSTLKVAAPMTVDVTAAKPLNVGTGGRIEVAEGGALTFAASSLQTDALNVRNGGELEVAGGSMGITYLPGSFNISGVEGQEGLLKISSGTCTVTSVSSVGKFLLGEYGRLVMTNGVFYSECVSGRDWRTDKNWNKEIQ